MKKIIVLIILLSCSAPLKEQDRSFDFRHVFANKTQEILKRKIIGYLNTYIISGKSSIQTDQLGIISANINEPDYDSSLLANYSLFFTMMVKYADDKLEIRYIAKYLIKSTIDLNNFKVSRKEVEYFIRESDKTQLANYFNEFNEKFIEYIKRNDTFFE